MKAKYWWSAILTLFAVVVVSCTNQATTSTDTATANTSINMCYSGISGTQIVTWYAQDKGLFEKHSVKVSLSSIEGGSDATTAVLTGNTEVCQIAGSAVVNAVVAGEDLVFVGGIINTYPYSLMVTPNIKTAEDLRGKALAVSKPGSASDAAIREILRTLNLKPDEDVTILAVGGQGERLAAMETGQVVGTVVSVPETIEAKEKGYQVLVEMSKLDIPYQHTGIVTTRTYIESNRAVVSGVMKAVTEAIALMQTDKSGTMEVMAKYMLLDPQEDEPSLVEAYDVLVQNYLPQIPYPSVEGIQTLLTQLEAENANAANTKPEDVVDLTIVKELETNGFIAGLYNNPQ
ncbi:ABC transporter substrate-binding protein [Oscillatoria sp. FACHB-1407]|uniref:ABC transporter substrate-binding protein n=1 Tax=Oscillatoria sp. FACHB-1407 TaxID=2692847 RepID=UPI001688D3FB|nr:ABC transporter substrate-binding protein [Oscillatoria sp. FACHB-1407]MBD2461875.1 ABC transporter substrate-binding protein [Oscillatoria sp. FACHB-1407]